MKTCFLLAEKDDRPAVASLTWNFQLQALHHTLHVQLQTFYRFLILDFRLSTDSSFSTSNFLLALYFPLQRFYRLPESSISNRLAPSNNFHLQISCSRLVSQNVRSPCSCRSYSELTKRNDVLWHDGDFPPRNVGIHRWLKASNRKGSGPVWSGNRIRGLRCRRCRPDESNTVENASCVTS